MNSSIRIWMKVVLSLACLACCALVSTKAWASAADEHGHGGGHADVSDEHSQGAGDRHDEAPGATLDRDSASKAGISTARVGPGIVSETAFLTGRILLDPDSTYEIRARFPGLVTEVFVALSHKVSKGELLARIESNVSLTVYDVVAPAEGILIKKNTNVGNVASDEPIFTIANLSTVWVEFHVFPRDLPQIKVGQEIHVRTLEGSHEARVSIVSLLPIADAQSQTAIAMVKLDNPDEHWRPGIAVEGDVHVLEKEVSAVVRRLAIQRLGDKDVVFVKEGDRYHSRPVIVGDGDGDFVEIRSGLQQNEEYVTYGSFVLKSEILKSTAEHVH